MQAEGRKKTARLLRFILHPPSPILPNVSVKTSLQIKESLIALLQRWSRGATKPFSKSAPDEEH